MKLKDFMCLVRQQKHQSTVLNIGKKRRKKIIPYYNEQWEEYENYNVENFDCVENTLYIYLEDK